jgi:hypothetical protein
MGAPWVPFVFKKVLLLQKRHPNGTHGKTTKVRNGAIFLASGVFEKSMSGAFHAGDRGSNPLGDANNIKYLRDFQVRTE